MCAEIASISLIPLHIPVFISPHPPQPAAQPQPAPLPTRGNHPHSLTAADPPETGRLPAGKPQKQLLSILRGSTIIERYNANGMRRGAIIALAAFLLIAVAAVLVSPAVVLDAAKLRSPSSTLALSLPPEFSAELPARQQGARLSAPILPNRSLPAHLVLHPSFELNCARLC